METQTVNPISPRFSSLCKLLILLSVLLIT